MHLDQSKTNAGFCGDTILMNFGFITCLAYINKYQLLREDGL
jgi:hypothetical protein